MEVAPSIASALERLRRVKLRQTSNSSQVPGPGLLNCTGLAGDGSHLPEE
jgi:hypothetical protein